MNAEMKYDRVQSARAASPSIAFFLFIILLALLTVLVWLAESYLNWPVTMSRPLLVSGIAMAVVAVVVYIIAAANALRPGQPFHRQIYRFFSPKYPNKP